MTRHLLVIGGQRCGTTRLHELLDAHPEITMARPARPEPKVFVSADLTGRGLEWYRRTYFAHARSESLLGEKSTSYLEDAAAPARAAAMLGAAEIVVQLRDPVARAVSNWRFSTAHGVEDRPLVRALEENLRGPRDWDPTRTSVSPYAYLERGRYVEHLEPWFATFPETMHVCFLEDGVGEPAPMAGLYATLGVDPGFRPPHEQRQVNASTGAGPDLPDALVQRLRDYYHDSDVRLAERLRRPLPWQDATAPVRGPATTVNPRPIPSHRPGLEGAELDYLRQSVQSGRTSSGGPFSERAGALLADQTGAEEVLLTTSCTAALELSALLLDLRPGDTVVVPSFTFTSDALAFVRQGARILFCDIEPRTLGLDPGHLATLLDETVRAVVPTHYAGIACDVQGIRAVLADRPDVAVVEDNAHGLYGRWHDQPLGSLGRFATLSFHETKNFTCGEGGALLLNDGRDVDRARVLYDKGTDRRAFLLGQVDKYSWKDVGSSFGLSDTLAACLTAQLERHEAIQSKRRTVFDRYAAALAPHAVEHDLRLPVVPDHCDPAYHLFYVLVRDRSTRDAALAAMRADGIGATFHYVPLHSADAGRRFAASPADCPVTDDVSGRLLRLPFANDLTAPDAERVVSSLLAALHDSAG